MVLVMHYLIEMHHTAIVLHQAAAIVSLDLRLQEVMQNTTPTYNNCSPRHQITAFPFIISHVMSQLRDSLAHTAQLQECSCAIMMPTNVWKCQLLQLSSVIMDMSYK
jgi:hypothetical protein